MTEVLTCPQCSATVPPDAPGGVCPYCVLQLAGNEGSGSNPTAAFPSAPTLPTLTELAAIFPQLEILELIGRGGMGAVYKARQPNLDRMVALKILLPDISKDPTFAERFSREARALARLNHPHIVSVYDSGNRGGLYYFIMEYVDGVNLRQAIQAEQISPEKALAIVPQICEALQYAHEEGVVHRDIKPENVLLDRKGRVKVADFGLAKLLGLATPDITLTGTRQAMGTLHYMAPEQYERPQAVDHRADIYSLGVVFYELLTGKLPLGRFALPSEKVRVDVRLDDVVLKSLEREPERRYQYVSEVKTEVDSIAHSPAQAAPQRPQETVFAAGRALHAPPPRPSSQQELSDLGRLLAILGGIALAMMPLLCVAGAFASYIDIGPMSLRGGMLAGSAGGLLMFVAGAVLLIWGLTLKRTTPEAAVPPEKDPMLSQQMRERAQQAVVAPAWALIIVAAIHFFVAAFVSLVVFGRISGDELGFLVAAGVQFVVAMVILIGAARMRRLQSYGLAMTAAIVAILPTPTLVVWLLGLPIGIWALAVLCRSEVRAGFGVARPAPSDRGRKATSVVAVAITIIAGMLFIPMLLLCGLFFGYTTVSKAPTVASYKNYSPEMGATKTTESKPAAPEAIEWIDGQPRLSRSIPQFAGFPLDEGQVAAINKALVEAHTDYLKIEKDHTRRTINDLGHQIVTVTPFPKELTRLEDSFWTKVDEVVTDDSSRGALRQQLTLGTLFPFGQTDYSIEIWKVGTWYSFSYPQFGSGQQPSKVPELPANIKRFWHPPEEKNESKINDH